MMQRGGEVGMQWLSNNWGRIKWVWCSVGDGETSVVHSPNIVTKIILPRAKPRRARGLKDSHKGY